MTNAARLIELLGLQPLPLEGGYFRETYRSAVPFSGSKSAGTAIYYLLTPETCSALHRLPTDEVFHLYLGGPVRMLQLHAEGGKLVKLGTDFEAGEVPQLVVPRGVWQGSVLAPGVPFALMGTTMAPGFDFSDYEAGDRAKLVAAYPDFRDWIERLTPPG